MVVKIHTVTYRYINAEDLEKELKTQFPGVFDESFDLLEDTRSDWLATYVIHNLDYWVEPDNSQPLRVASEVVRNHYGPRYPIEEALNHLCKRGDIAEGNLVVKIPGSYF